MTVRVAGAVSVEDPTPSWRPVGTVAKRRSTVWGSSWMLVLAVAPAESTAVNTSDSEAGYS
jgi:hypothetical protein